MVFQFAYANETQLEKLNQAREVASQAIANQDFKRALEAYNELSVQYSEDIAIANDMAVILSGMGKLDEARSILERAIIKNKTTGPAFLNLREILARQASISYTKALNRKSPSDVLALRSPGLDAIQRTNELVNLPVKKTPVKKEDLLTKDNLLALGTEIPVVVIKNLDEEIKRVLADWAKAWSSKDFNKYINFYSVKFKSKKFKSKNSWTKYRKPRVNKKGAIKVSIMKERIQLISDQLAEVTFIQKYKSKNLRLTTSKRMKLEKKEGDWKIIFEGT